MKKGKTTLNRWERYLVKEIGIEFKACLYFFAILLYYCLYQLCNGVFVASILHMAEMILLTYLIGYLQVYLFWNFDESDHLRGKEILGLLICTAIYTGISFFGNWFHHQFWVTIGFAAYLIFLYVCVFCVYKIRRIIDEKSLNSDLDLFKTRTKD